MTVPGDHSRVDILGFGTYDKRLHPRVEVLLEGLRHNGLTVTESNFPLGVTTAGRVAALSNPKSAVAFGLTLLSRWGRLVTDSLNYRGRRHPDSILVGYLGHFDVVLARMLFPRTRIVLDHLVFAADTAKDRHLQGGRIKHHVLKGIDALALRCASVILLDTPAHLRLLPSRLGAKAMVVPVGAPDAWFKARRDTELMSSRGHVSIVFFGLFTPLQGAPTIANAIRMLDEAGVECHVTLIGDGQDASECRDILISCGSGAVKLEWRDWVDSAELPALVTQHDICLGIFGTTEKAMRVVPNKAYQGMAAGCALVTSDTQPQRDMLGDAVTYVPPGDSSALARTLEHLIANGEALTRMRQAAAACADELFTSAAVTAQLAKLLS